MSIATRRKIPPNKGKPTLQPVAAPPNQPKLGPPQVTAGARFSCGAEIGDTVPGQQVRRQGWSGKGRSPAAMRRITCKLSAQKKPKGKTPPGLATRRREFSNPAPMGQRQDSVGDGRRGSCCCARAAVAGCQNDQQQSARCSGATCGKTATCSVERTIVILDAATCAHAVDCFDFSFAAVDLAVATLNAKRVCGVAGFTQNCCLSCILCGCTCGNGHCYSCGKCENLFHLDQTPKSISVHNSYDTYQKSLKAMYRIAWQFAPADTKKSHKKQEIIGEKMLIGRYRS